MVFSRSRFLLNPSLLGIVVCLSLSANGFADDKPGHADEKHHDHQQDAATMEKDVAEALSELSTADRKLAEAQRFCVMMEYSRLGAMGAPIRVMIDGKPVLCAVKAVLKKPLRAGRTR